MGLTDTDFWIGFAAIVGFVVTLSIVGPAVRAYTNWKMKRAFRARLKAYRQQGSRGCSSHLTGKNNRNA